MSSLLTNTSAMVALQTLRSINQDLDKTTNRVSTGLRVSTAADNAAYWSIATTIKSDNGALGAVQDSLGLGASTLATTYTGLDAAKTLLNSLKEQLTTATGENVDKSKVQQSIASILTQLQATADSSSFSGQNWLSTGSSTDFTKAIVSSLSRDSNNQLTIGSIDIDIQNVRLYGDGTTQFGLIDKTIDLTEYSATGANAATVETAAVDFAAADDTITFSIAKNGAPGVVVTINQGTLTDAGLSGTEILSNADLRAVYEQALEDAGISGIAVDVDSSGNVSFSSLDDFTVSFATATGTTGLDPTDLGLNIDTDGDMTTSAASAGAIAVADIDITSATSDDIEGYLRVVDEALSQLTDAASAIGAYQNRVSSQQTFVKALIDANTSAVGVLVDANMEEESTKLKALQTQQQLAVQSLSIANSSTQNILVLFR
jgi:flagellin